MSCCPSLAWAQYHPVPPSSPCIGSTPAVWNCRRPSSARPPFSGSSAHAASNPRTPRTSSTVLAQKSAAIALNGPSLTQVRVGHNHDRHYGEARRRYGAGCIDVAGEFLHYPGQRRTNACRGSSDPSLRTSPSSGLRGTQREAASQRQPPETEPSPHMRRMNHGCCRVDPQHPVTGSQSELSESAPRTGNEPARIGRPGSGAWIRAAAGRPIPHTGRKAVTRRQRRPSRNAGIGQSGGRAAEAGSRARDYGIRAVDQEYQARRMTRFRKKR